LVNAVKTRPTWKKTFSNSLGFMNNLRLAGMANFLT
jgi:hypothetical protein